MHSFTLTDLNLNDEEICVDVTISKTETRFSITFMEQDNVKVVNFDEDDNGYRFFRTTKTGHHRELYSHFDRRRDILKEYRREEYPESLMMILEALFMK